MKRNCHKVSFHHHKVSSPPHRFENSNFDDISFYFFNEQTLNMIHNTTPTMSSLLTTPGTHGHGRQAKGLEKGPTTRRMHW